MHLLTRFGLLVVVFLWISSYAIAKPSPPPELMEILEEFSEIEEQFEAGEWENARKQLPEILEKHNIVYAQCQGLIPEKINQNFIDCFDKFKINLTVQDKEQTERSFVTLRLALFATMDHFSYEVHPVIALMQKFIGDEAKEALEKGNYREVRYEIEEVYAFFKDSTSMLMLNGVEREAIDSFQQTMTKAMLLSEKKDRETLESTLNQLEVQLIAFQKSFR